MVVDDVDENAVVCSGENPYGALHSKLTVSPVTSPCGTISDTLTAFAKYSTSS